MSPFPCVPVFSCPRYHDPCPRVLVIVTRVTVIVSLFPHVPLSPCHRVPVYPRPMPSRISCLLCNKSRLENQSLLSCKVAVAMPHPPTHTHTLLLTVIGEVVRPRAGSLRQALSPDPLGPSSADRQMRCDAMCIASQEESIARRYHSELTSTVDVCTSAVRSFLFLKDPSHSSLYPTH